jgi:hypothetical protein
MESTVQPLLTLHKKVDLLHDTSFDAYKPSLTPTCAEHVRAEVAAALLQSVFYIFNYDANETREVAEPPQLT